MRYLRMKQAIAWDMMGWFLFVLICLVIAIILIGQFGDGSHNLLDGVFGVFE